jgi:hypothetical protein
VAAAAPALPPAPRESALPFAPEPAVAVAPAAAAAASGTSAPPLPPPVPFPRVALAFRGVSYDIEVKRGVRRTLLRSISG